MPAGVVVRGCRATFVRAASALRRSSSSSACLELLLVAHDADVASASRSWSSSWIANGFSPSSRSNGSSASFAYVVDLRARRSASRSCAFAYSAAWRPAMRPKTRRSESELPPRRFAPCMPPAHSPAAKRPGTRVSCVSASTRMPPIDVVARRADLHRLLRDVDVGQLLELVVHRRELLLDVLGRAARGDVEEDAAVRRAAAGLHLGVDRARDDVARRAAPACAARSTFRRRLVEPAIGLLLGVGRLVRVERRGCSRT